MAEEQTTFESLVGKTLRFYGVENNFLCVAVGRNAKRLAFEAIENEDDGYRSMLDEVREVSIDGKVFFDTPIAKVILQDADTDCFRGWKLVDAKDGHVWLLMGTDNANDYYPTFTFQYEPKASGGA